MEKNKLPLYKRFWNFIKQYHVFMQIYTHYIVLPLKAAERGCGK